MDIKLKKKVPTKANYFIQTILQIKLTGELSDLSHKLKIKDNVDHVGHFLQQAL